MSKSNSKWIELFLPVIEDFKNINRESDTSKISSNNWKLLEDDVKYQQTIEKIKGLKSESNENETKSLALQ